MPKELNADVAVVDDAVALDPNRDACKADAENLGRIHDILSDATADVSSKRKAFFGGYNVDTTDEGREALRLAYETAQTALNDYLDACWHSLLDMPKGTCVGDATRHSVALQHYGGHLTSTFGVRMTVADAKALNKMAFGK